MQAAGIADRLKARNIGFAISDAALDVVVKVRRDFSLLLWPAKPQRSVASEAHAHLPTAVHYQGAAFCVLHAVGISHPVPGKRHLNFAS